MTRTRSIHRGHNPIGNQPPIDLPDNFEIFGPPRTPSLTTLSRSDIALLCAITALGSFCAGWFAAALYYT